VGDELGMLKIWANASVNIEVAARLIEDFFRKRNFSVRQKRSDSNAIIDASNNVDKASFLIRIHNAENSFEVEFAPKEPISLRYFGNLLSTFGGGPFVLKRLRSEEAAVKIESEFWIYVSELVEEMRSVSKLK
jgi:hypothetical protein